MCRIKKADKVLWVDNNTLQLSKILLFSFNHSWCTHNENFYDNHSGLPRYARKSRFSLEIYGHVVPFFILILQFYSKFKQLFVAVEIIVYSF